MYNNHFCKGPISLKVAEASVWPKVSVLDFVSGVEGSGYRRGKILSDLSDASLHRGLHNHPLTASFY